MAKIGRRTGSFACIIILVFVVLLLATAEAGAGGGNVESKRSCESQSHRFKGKCMSDHNCGAVCNTEGFHGGNCRGFRRRCFCTRPC